MNPPHEQTPLQLCIEEIHQCHADILKLQKKIKVLQIDLDIANHARRDALDTLEEFRGYDGDEDLWAAMKQERDQLRRILSHVPAKIAIAAKEAAGFPNYIHTAGDFQ